MLCSDPVWTFSTERYSCSEFVSSSNLGIGSCEEPWAQGLDGNGRFVTAYVACEVSCGDGGAVRDCVLPAEPEPEPEPEREPETNLCAE